MRARVKVSTFLKGGGFIAVGQIIDGDMADEAVKAGVAEKIEETSEPTKKRGRSKK